jgi:hypothetical protein
MKVKSDMIRGVKTYVLTQTLTKSFTRQEVTPDATIKALK